MKKTALALILSLSMLLLLVPINTAITASSPASLSHNIELLKEQYLDDAIVDTTADALEDPTPFWVDIVNAEDYTNGGEGIYVAVLDTGLLTDWPFFFSQANIKADWGKGFTHDVWWDSNINDFVFGPLLDNRGFITHPFRGSGHGTHVTSTIVGYRFRTATADMWIRGVAPKATIIPVLVLDAWEVPYPGGTMRFTGGTDEMVAAGIRYVGDLAESEHIKIIINMSLGGPEPTAMIEEAIDYAIGKGVIVVAAAGNQGTVMDWPGAYPQVISAAAGGWTEQWITRPPQSRWFLNDVTEKLNTRDYWGNNWQIYLEEFSGRPNADLGQFWKDLDVATPGASVVGPYKNYFSTSVGYYYLWGTSMATPHVSAIAAIIAQMYPEFNQADMEWIMKYAGAHYPMAADGAYILDPWGFWDYKWNDHDAGSGWLTVPGAMHGAFVYTRGKGGFTGSLEA